MSFLIKLKTWLTRLAFLLAGVLGTLAGTALWSKIASGKNEQEEEVDEDDLETVERYKRISREAEAEVRSLSDDDFTERYPSVPRDAGTGGDRFVARVKAYLQSRGGGGDRGGDHGDRSTGD